LHHTIESYKVSDTLNNLEKDSNLKAMTVIRYIVILLMVLTIGTITKASFAKQIAGIVATINDEAISGTDLEARLNFAILTTGLPKTDEVKKSLIPQTLNALIDETLKAQELKKNNINQVDIVGLATDYCVKYSSIDAYNEGFKTNVLRFCVRGISVETTETAFKEMKDIGISII